MIENVFILSFKVSENKDIKVTNKNRKDNICKVLCPVTLSTRFLIIYHNSTFHCNLNHSHKHINTALNKTVYNEYLETTHLSFLLIC